MACSLPEQVRTHHASVALLTWRDSMLTSHDDPASDSATAVAARVGRLVVGISMDDQCASVGVEQAICPGPKPDERVRRLECGCTVGFHRQVGEVTSVRALWVTRAVLPICRVVVITGGHEVWRVAPSDRVQVNPVHSGRQVPDLDIDLHAPGCLGKCG
jgi:hypothetical protein